jgi:hypothetical protein
MRKVGLPDPDKNYDVKEQKALVFDGQCKYGVIFGADFLSKTGIDIKYSSRIIEWFNNELPMRNPHQLDNKEYLAMAEVLKVQLKAELLFGMDWYNPTCHTSEILDAKYEKVSTDGVVDQLSHLNDKQKQDLKVLLKDFTRLFDGTQGVYLHKKFHIDLIPGARPKHSQPYAIPCIHLAAFKKEIDRLVQIKEPSPQCASKWCSPTFVTPKKDNIVCWVSNLQELNKKCYVNNTHYQSSMTCCAQANWLCIL